jgi:hypothetical protein
MIPYMLYDIPDEVLIKVKAKRGKPNKDINSINNNGVVENAPKVASNVDFYNKFLRKEGQPVLDKEQYDIMVRERNDRWKNIFEAIGDRAQYPLTPGDMITGTMMDETKGENMFYPLLPKPEPVLMPPLDPKLAPKLVGTKGKLETKGISEAFTNPDGASASPAPPPFLLKPPLASYVIGHDPVDIPNDRTKAIEDAVVKLYATKPTYIAELSELELREKYKDLTKEDVEKALVAVFYGKAEPELDLKEEKEKLRQDSVTDGVIADVKEKYIEKDIEEKWEDMKAMEERLHFKSNT